MRFSCRTGRFKNVRLTTLFLSVGLLGLSVVTRRLCRFFCRSTWESHCSPLSDVWVFWMRSSHMSIKVVFATVDVSRHGLAATFYLALVALALTVRSHVSCQVLLCGERLVTS